MGWCSATEIIDNAIDAADAAVEEAYELLGVDPDRVTVLDVRDALDDALRPLVAKIAAKLRDEDWDCEQDSSHFDRFPQELTGWDDDQYAAWLSDMIEGDPLNAEKHTAALSQLQQKRTT